MSGHLQVAVTAAQLAGQYQREQLDTISHHEYKSRGDPVSEVDLESERIILDHLSSEFPDYAILSEEAGAIGNSDKRWIVDPLDGTSNYIRNHPDFSVSIALELSGQLDTGVIYRPASDALFVATRNNGTDGCGRTLGVSDTDALANALVALPYSSSCKRREDIWSTHRSVGAKTEGMRLTGSGALDLAYLASGTFDAVYGFEQSLWDRAAGLLLVEMAGGQITDHRGRDDYAADFVASNGELHQDIMDVTRSEN